MEKSYIQRVQIHKLNKMAGLYPSVKALIIILYSICAFIFGTVKLTDYDLSLLLIPWFLLIPLLNLISGYFFKALKALKSVAFIAAFIFLVQAFLIPGGRDVFTFGFLKIREQGLQTAIYLSFMVMDIAGIFVWFFQGTETKEIASALESSGMNYKATYVFVSTLQMIEVLGKNSKTIMNAQKARGVETEGNVFVRTKAFLPTLVPLILGAVISSEEKSLTLYARGFSVQGEKTHVFKLEKSGWEKPVLIVSIVITVLVFAGRLILWLL